MSFTFATVEGNIGSGKSTLLEYLKKRYTNIIFVPEPVELWEKIKDKEGTTMLHKFYGDQEKYAFSFQMMAYISRLSILRHAVKNLPATADTIVISERSLYTDKFIFAKMLYDQGKIEDVNYQIYLNWFDEFVHDFPITHRIYIKADPEICYDRIHHRGRQGEETIPLAYLQQCHEYHEAYMKPHANVLELDGNQDVYQHPAVLDGWLTAIDKLLHLRSGI
jgi:deoxyadenosine/deoxycytidine kinase